MKNIVITITLLVGSVLLGACTHQNQSTLPAEEAMFDDVIIDDRIMDTFQSMEVQLDEVNNSEQSGTAMLTEDESGNVVVRLQLSGGMYTAPQPAHIHVGACPGVGSVAYPLTNVVDGMSVTTLEGVSLADVSNVDSGLAINVHKSAEEASVYTACGELR